MDRIKNYFSTKFQVGILWALAICPIPADFWNTEVFNLPTENKVELALKIAPANLDMLRREKLAEILSEVPLKSADMHEKLCVDLAETKASRAYCTNLNFSADKLLQRARVLTTWNRNAEVVAALATVNTCEATYLTGLAHRKLRNYAQARQTLRLAADTCEGDFKKKALFLNARIAAMNPSETAVAVLDDFLAKYPNDSFTDDVLLWKAHTLLDLDREVDGAQVLNQIFNEHPKGDMREQTIFERAMQFARLGQMNPAIHLFETLKTPQGMYWSGRLRMYPQFESLKLNPDRKQRHEGKEILQNLAKEMPFNYYGHWAAQLTKTKSSLKPPVFMLPPSQALKADPTFQIMSCLKEHGKTQEAVWVVDRLMRQYRGENDRFNLANAYLELHRPDKAHQAMRGLGLAFPRTNKPEFVTQFPWYLSFPKAFSEAYHRAAELEKIPVDWLMGLSREESMFDKDVISWAGAVGLCQLMPTTAKLTESQLLDPLVNIDAGAKHLNELSQKLDHPIKIIASYNAGAGPVQRWAKQYAPDVPMDYFVEQIPYEQTRNYVKKVTSAWASYAWLNGRLKKPLYLIQNKP
ncbi:MAG: transglycosylase SLT domain-containing protein [Myxococcota bacterium]